MRKEKMHILNFYSTYPAVKCLYHYDVCVCVCVWGGGGGGGGVKDLLHYKR